MMECGVRLIPYVTTYNDNKRCYYMLSIDSELLLNYDDRDAVRVEQAITWTSELLVNWKDSQEVTHNLWQFDNLEELEKFKILFLLRWT